KAVDRMPGANENRHRHVTTAALGRQKCRNCFAVERIASDAVNRVCRHHDQPPCARGTFGRADTGFSLILVTAIEHCAHASHLPTPTAPRCAGSASALWTAVTNRGRPARSSCATTSANLLVATRV